MKRLVLLLLLGIPGVAAATSGVGWDMLPFEPNSHDKPSLQSGLRLYTNYCMGCHSLRFQRYERTADDLEIPHEIFMEQIVHSGAKSWRPSWRRPCPSRRVPGLVPHHRT